MKAISQQALGLSAQSNRETRPKTMWNNSTVALTHWQSVSLTMGPICLMLIQLIKEDASRKAFLKAWWYLSVFVFVTFTYHSMVFITAYQKKLLPQKNPRENSNFKMSGNPRFAHTALFIFTLLGRIARKDGDQKWQEWELKAMNEKRANVVTWRGKRGRA